MQANKETYKFQRMSTLAERIKSARSHAKLTQKALAQKAGVEQPVISQLETGKNLQSAHLPKIAHACGVSAIWLSENIGPMISAAKVDSNVGEARQPVESFRYPVISWVAAGAWAEAVEPFPPGYSDRYELSDYDSKGPAFWLEVKGDSMTSPVGTSITEGTLILVDTEADAQSGKLVVAKLADSDQATFKKLVDDGGRRFLKPLNPAYPIEMCAENCRIVGVVVRALQKL
nr:S24 family peptidase [Pseudomonas sp. SbOxS1]